MNIAHLGSINELLNLATALSKSGLMPNGLSKPEAILAIALKGQELGIPPMAAIAGITVIQGKPIVSPQLMLSLVERSGKLQDWRIIEESNEAVAVEFIRRGRSPVSKRFSMEDAKKMGLASKDNWQKQPRTMMQWRAIAAAIRVAFPDVIDGCYTPEEMNMDVEVAEDGSINIQHQPAQVVEQPAVAQQAEPAVKSGSGGKMPEFEPRVGGSGGRLMLPSTKNEFLSLAKQAGYALKPGERGLSLKEFVARILGRENITFAELTEDDGQRCVAEMKKLVGAFEDLGAEPVGGSLQ